MRTGNRYKGAAKLGLAVSIIIVASPFISLILCIILSADFVGNIIYHKEIASFKAALPPIIVSVEKYKEEHGYYPRETPFSSAEYVYGGQWPILKSDACVQQRKQLMNSSAFYHPPGKNKQEMIQQQDAIRRMCDIGYKDYVIEKYLNESCAMYYDKNKDKASIGCSENP